jgi:DNA helicase-2/ATP-dependent DNA helicase PcrA
MLNVLRTHRDVLEQYQQRFKYVMVDEYQDTNQVQYLWLRLLAQGRKNICVVGDDDQSIYSWRGAEVANILRFEKDFPGAKVIRLEQNYRSTPDILAAASGLIGANSQRLGKTLWTEKNGGDKVRVIGVWDGPEEARRVGEEIERLEREGARSTGRHPGARAVPDPRVRRPVHAIGLPIKIVGGFRFYERAEIRDALAYLRLIASRATIWRSSASTTPPSAGWATRRWKSCTAMPGRGRAAGRWPRSRLPIPTNCRRARAARCWR